MQKLKRILAISKIDLISTFRNKSAVFFGFLFPFIFIFVFGQLGEGTIVYEVAFYPGSEVDNPIYEALTEVDALNFNEDLSESEIESLLEKGELDSAFLIESSVKDGVPHYNMQLLKSAVKQDESGVIESILTGMVDKMNLAVAGIEEAPIDLTVVEVKGREYTAIDFVLPGQLAFGLLNVGVMGTAFLLVSLRETLVLKRFFATPIKRSHIILGLGLSKLIFGLLQAVVIILVGVWLFDFTLVNGVPTFLEMLLFSTFGLVVFLGFGFLISSYSKDTNSVAPMANLVTLPQFLLAGTFFPITLFPDWLQPISKILPLTYLNRALRLISFEGVPLTELRVEILALLIWGVVVYLLAVRKFSWNSEKNGSVLSRFRRK